ncbi:hypothetical protein A3H75_00470 [Candidatus Uhrbacteria bacterium RIFCSPLOWO2_02_FULL_51_9]|uniref:LemA family protein n=1 Tax=Candidatus Uhrbacteria bacterium RIFCSPLOWO2_02_FULL_51_9 TaxID=1802410 RepID=A0A1F7VE40_9BACT|nr:MAG: hypothetical protein A3H75_00470 [Candidatus Uhrbacteria bacterium RIFCSPLOWO2_02_FULL_51_9]
MAGQKSMIKWVIIGAVVLILVGGTWSTYNKLVTSNESIDGQWAQVQAQYQRRVDLIPGLVNATRGFFKQEQALYEKITQARAAYGSAKTPAEQVSTANVLESNLSRLLLIVESNPEIKSNQVVTNLMAELAGTENRISVERMRFNDSVRVYNVIVKRFPSNIIANIFSFDAREFFQAAEGADKAVPVNLDVN